MSTPTNLDIAKLIGTNHEEVQERLKRVEEQVKLTNGRVRDLERVQLKNDAVEEYKKNQSGASVVVNQSNEMSPIWKLAFGLLGILGTALAIIAVFAGK